MWYHTPTMIEAVGSAPTCGELITKYKTFIKSKTMKKPESKVKTGILKTYKTSKGKWEIYSYTKKKIGKIVIRYGNRLLANNGNIICSNKDFNSRQSAVKNMKAVQMTAL